MNIKNIKIMYNINILNIINSIIYINQKKIFFNIKFTFFVKN